MYYEYEIQLFKKKNFKNDIVHGKRPYTGEVDQRCAMCSDHKRM